MQGPDHEHDMLSLLPRTLLLPPVSLLIAALAGLLLTQHRRLWTRFGRVVLWVSLLGLLALSMPIMPRLMLVPLEAGFTLQIPPPGTPLSPQAIVILSGDGTVGEPEGGILPAARIGSLTLERLWAGVALQSRVHLPILLTGGLFRPGRPTLAAMMAETMERDFHATPRWVEDRSVDTWENAEYSAALLKQDGITSVYVVSHAWHLRRARMAFAHFGITMWPAPLDRDAFGAITLYDFMPSADAWQDSYYALHEWVGCAAYALKTNAPWG